MPRDLFRAITGGVTKKPGEPLQPMVTPQAIQEIEDSLGDVGRGTDYPMSRKRRGSLSSKNNTQPTSPPPVPPKHKLLRQIPVFESGTSLPLPRVRGASAPEHTTADDPQQWKEGRESLLFDEDRDDRNRQEENDFDFPIPPMPTWSPPPIPPPHTTPWYPPQELRHEVEDENSHQPVEPIVVEPIVTRRAPSASAPPRPTPKYSLFPALGNRDPAKTMSSSPSPRASPKPAPPIPARNPARMRQVSAVSMAASDVSRASSSSYVAGGELPRPVQSSDLIPDASTIPPPPAFRHNWDNPNRARARGAVNPATSHHAGYTGRPVGSRPRPQQTQTSQTDPQGRDSLTAGTFPEPTIPVLSPETTTTATPVTRAALRQPLTATSSRDSTAYQTGQFTYYPVMSPYEAEAAIGSGGTPSGVYQTVTTLPDSARGTTTASSESTTTSRPTTGMTATGSSASTISTVSSMSTITSTFAPTPQSTSTQTSTPTPTSTSTSTAISMPAASMVAARMFPVLDHDLMSAEQAAAAVEAARHVRNTIFIDRGFDMPVRGGDEGGVGNGGNGRINRSSSYYGEEKEEKDEEKK